jgi:integrase
MKRAQRTADHQLVKVGTNLYKNGHGVYFGWIFRKNKQVKKSLKTKDLITANQKLVALLSRVEKLKDARKVLFQDLASRWLAVIQADQKSGSWERRNSAVNGLNRYFKGQWLRSISVETVENWKMRRASETTARGKKVSARTLNIDLETLKLILGYGVKHGYLLENVAADIPKNKVNKKQVTPPTKAQFSRLVAELRMQSSTIKAADFVEFLGYSGLRLDEANEVVWGDVEWERGKLYVSGGEGGSKNHEEKRIPLFPPLRELLERIRAKVSTAGSNERIFPKRVKADSNPQADGQAAGYNCDSAIKAACRRAKLPPFRHHDCRHFYCSNCIEAGVDFATIAQWLRHKDGGKLAAGTYGHLRADHTDEQAAKVTFSVVRPEPMLNSEAHKSVEPGVLAWLPLNKGKTVKNLLDSLAE